MWGSGCGEARSKSLCTSTHNHKSEPRCESNYARKSGMKQSDCLVCWKAPLAAQRLVESGGGSDRLLQGLYPGTLTTDFYF